MRIFIVSLLLLLSSCDKQSAENSKNNVASVETKKVVILLYGVPACGKLTIAKEIAKKYNLDLMDNHFFNNIIFPYVELTTPNVVSILPEVNKIKKIWMDNVAEYGRKDKGFIFTDVLIDGISNQSVEDTENFAKKMGYKFLPVKLVCNNEQIAGRINTKERKARYKLTDIDAWKKYVDSTKFLDVEGSLILKNSNIDATIDEIDKNLPQ